MRLFMQRYAILCYAMLRIDFIRIYTYTYLYTYKYIYIFGVRVCGLVRASVRVCLFVCGTEIDGRQPVDSRLSLLGRRPGWRLVGMGFAVCGMRVEIMRVLHMPEKVDGRFTRRFNGSGI